MKRRKLTVLAVHVIVNGATVGFFRAQDTGGGLFFSLSEKSRENP